MDRNGIFVLLGIAAFLYFQNQSSASSSSSSSSSGLPPTQVPIGVLPLASNGYFQGPAYTDSRIGLQVSPYYFPSGLIAFLADGAGVQYDPATGNPLNSPFPPLTS